MHFLKSEQHSAHSLHIRGEVVAPKVPQKILYLHQYSCNTLYDEDRAYILNRTFMLLKVTPLSLLVKRVSQLPKAFLL